jgi:hypothetical protein
MLLPPFPPSICKRAAGIKVGIEGRRLDMTRQSLQNLALRAKQSAVFWIEPLHHLERSAALGEPAKTADRSQPD